MRKTFFLSMLLVSLSVSLMAQDVASDQNTTQSHSSSSSSKKKPKFWIGPKLGFDYSPANYNFAEIKDQLNENYQVGIMMQLGRIIYLQPEVYYASQKVLDDAGLSSAAHSIKVPVMLGLRFLNLGLFSLHVMGGPAFTFGLNDSDSFNGDKTMEWQVGAGIDIFGFITTDVRYQLQRGVSIADQIADFDPQVTPLNVTIGLKFR
jgi:hypothetical protein